MHIKHSEVASNNKAYSSLKFVKDLNENYYELLRLARISESTLSKNSDLENATDTLNTLHLYSKEHKRIIPLLNNKAKKLKIFNNLSSEIQDLLIKNTQQGIVTELAREQQLTKIIDLLLENNIPIILLKGAAFVGVLYEKLSPRTSNDLDILIQKKHWDKAVSLMKTIMNYYEKPNPDVFGDLYELSFTPKQQTGAALDLHSSLIHPLLFNVNYEKLWEESVSHPSYTNSNVRMLSAEHALLHQAIHAFKDMNFCKYNLLDSHELISQNAIDIERVIKIAKSWNAQIALYILLTNCKEIMDSNISPQLIEGIKPNCILERLSVILLRSRFTQPVGNNKPIRYRINQVLSQFVFTASIKRPLMLQWLFFKTLIKMRM
jgi:hypothetical protein